MSQFQSDDQEDEDFFLENLHEPEVIIQNGQIHLKRTRIVDMISGRYKKNESGSKKKVLTEEEKRQRAKRLKEIENERKKALKAAAKRAKLNKLSIVDEEDEVGLIK